MKKFVTALFTVLAAWSCVKPDTTLEVTLKADESIVATSYEYVKIPYSVVSGTGAVSVEFVASPDIMSVSTTPDSANPLAGVVTVKLGRTITEGQSNVKLTFSNGYTIVEKTVGFEQKAVQSKGADHFDISNAMQALTLEYRSNTECRVSIPSDASSWITSPVQDATKALADGNFVLQVAANEGFPRSCELKVMSTSDNFSVSYTVNQAGNEKTFRFVSSLSSPVVPSLGGTNVQGRVYWTDDLAQYEQWREGLRGSYRTSGDHVVTLKTIDASSLSFSSLDGISMIDFSEF